MQSEVSHAICGAKTRSGKPCPTRPMPNGRCRMHGGTHAVGMAHHNYKNGRHSKYMPTALLQRYAKALHDPDILNLTSEIALVDARLGELLEGYDQGIGAETLKAIRGEWRALVATKPGDASNYTAHFNALGSLIEQAYAKSQVWADIDQALSQRRKLADTERKRIESGQRSITLDQAMMVIQALTDIVKTHVTDKEQLAAISAEFARALGPVSPRKP